MKTSRNLSALFLFVATLMLSACERSSIIDPQTNSEELIPTADEKAPKIDYVLPQLGAVGTSVHLYGQRFSPVPSENQVWFGGVQVEAIRVVSARELIVDVPVGAHTGFISLLVNGRRCKGSEFIVTPTN